MTAIISGTGATIQAESAEALLVAMIRKLQQLERSAAYNPSNLNYATSGSSDDTESFTASINCNGTVTIDTDGAIKIVAIDYLSGISPSIFSLGADGTFKSSSLIQAIFEVGIYLESLELQTAKNPTQADYINWSSSNQDIGGAGQTRLSLSLLNFPLEQAINDNGDQVTRGKEYLL